jgi:hypothetical protein
LTARRKASARSPTLTSLREVRQQAFERVADLPNVVGSMIARKVVNGQMTSKLGLTVLVSEKVVPSRIPARQRIPKSVRAGKREVVLDVLHIPPMEMQSTFDPGVHLTNDLYENGTLSCLCRSPFGLVGMSCAHALDGPDQDIKTPTPIRIWSHSLEAFVPVGESRLGVQSRGLGRPGEFGFLDAGYFDVQHPELVASAQGLAVTPPRTPVPGMKVVGLGAMKGPRMGHVLGVEKVLYGLYSDVVIEVAPPGTFRGDSGMLWRTGEGFPVAIHGYGSQAPPGVGSRYTAAMLATRAERYLRVELLAALL